MPNPRLTKDQIDNLFRPLFAELIQRITEIAQGDEDLLFALRRKIAKDLTYQERSGPNERRKLKCLKRVAQNGKCPECQKELPARYCVLDRNEAKKGYTNDNTRLICPECDRQIQESRNFS